MISVTSNINQVVKSLESSMRSQLPFATAKALTDTAKTVREELKRDLKSVFDRPTPWIQNSPFMERATKSSLTATVGIRDQGGRVTPAQYLKEHFAGGARGNKPMERAMRAAGILPPGWLVAPGSGVKTDAYGNVGKATIGRILRELQGGGRRQQAGGTFRLFVVRPGEANRRTRHLAPGIWSVAKVGDQSIIKPAFLFINRATYRKVLDLPKLAQKVVSRDFERNFRAAFEQAMRTAR